MNLPAKALCAFITATIIGFQSSAAIIYVKIGGTGGGTSWADAKGTIQSALTAAASGDQIWIAEGTYFPTTDTDRTATFNLKNGVAVYGGFSGSETALSARDSTGRTHTTILSGEIQHDGILNNNSYHVVFSNVDGSSMLNSVTIERGCANHTGGIVNYVSGGAILNIAANPTFANLIIRDCYGDSGGGIANYNGSPIITRCSFINDTGGFGGGMYNDGGGTSFTGTIAYSTDKSPIFTNDSFANCKSGFGGGLFIGRGIISKLDKVVFFNNYADSYGGGLGCDDCTTYMTHVKFIKNDVRDTSGPVYGKGGGMFCDGTGPYPCELYDVLFANNHGGLGAAMCFWYGGTYGPILTNVTFSGNNTVPYPFLIGAAGQGNVLFTMGGTARLRNCIIDSVANGNKYFGGPANQYMVSNCSLPGAFPAGVIDSGGNLLRVDPMFIDTATGNYRLQNTSACINNGRNSFAYEPTDMDGNTRIAEATIDMGAYEHQPLPTTIQFAHQQSAVVYPNPTTDELNITGVMLGGATYRMLDITGSALIVGALQGTTNTISTQSLSHGIYLLELTMKSGEKNIVKVLKN